MMDTARARSEDWRCVSGFGESEAQVCGVLVTLRQFALHRLGADVVEDEDSAVPNAPIPLCRAVHLA
jgi:hypothetical protein